jgi:hypothetical protein
MTGPDPTTDAIKAMAELVTNSVAERDRRMVHDLTEALLAEGISDDVAARVLNRVTTGVPDPDKVITPSLRVPGLQTALDQCRAEASRPSYPTFGHGTMRPQAGG